MNVMRVLVSDLSEDPANVRLHPERNLEAIKASLRRFGQQKPIVVDERNVVRAGNGTLKAARELGWVELDAVRTGLAGPDAAAYSIADNRTGELAAWDYEALARMVESMSNDGVLPESLGWTQSELEILMGGLSLSLAADGTGSQRVAEPVPLASRFGAPPFSVLDARAGYWRERKQHWIAQGIRSELGRGANLLKYSDTVLRRGKPTEFDDYDGGDEWTGTGTSVFDPVLCELVYKWFAPVGGSVLDPFAGGSVRGIVAGKLGLSYYGVDLRSEQIEENVAQGVQILGADHKVTWLQGDSTVALDGLDSKSFDMIFTCPPYFDLEKYSDLPEDLSNMDYVNFAAAYEHIIRAAVRCLKDSRFAVIVAGEVRDERGLARNFVGDTIGLCLGAGLRLYNHAVLLTPLVSAGIRAARIFLGGRKLLPVHQHVLVFCKGAPQAAHEQLGDVPDGVADAASLAFDEQMESSETELTLQGEP